MATTAQSFNLLLTSAASKVPLLRTAEVALRRVCGDGVVIAGDIRPDALCSYVARQFWVMPRTEDTHREAIRDGCLSRRVRAVLPTRDGELAFWARQADYFARAGIQVIVSQTKAISLCLDKVLFFEFAKERGFPVITTSTALNAIDAQSFVVKERFGAGSQLIALNLPREQAIAHARTLKHPIYQPMIEGIEISVDAWLDQHHKAKGVVLRRRDLVQRGEAQVTRTFTNARIEAQCTQFLEALGLSGPVVLQALISDSSLHIIECNPRFGGASTASVAAGLDSVFWSLIEASGQDPAHYPFARSATELEQIRLPYDVYRVAHDPHL